jgi:hypothetical protein
MSTGLETGMLDQELDDLLDRTARPISDAANSAALDLVEPTKAAATDKTRVRRRVRRPAVVAGIVGGSVLLTAGASLAAYQLSIPPFQTIPDGIQRTTVPIPVNYERADGVGARCLAFMEFRNLDPGQLERVNGYIAAKNWTGFGQDLVASSPAQTDPDRQFDVLTQKLDTTLYRQAADVIPGLLFQSQADETPTYAGDAISCQEAKQ